MLNCWLPQASLALTACRECFEIQCIQDGYEFQVRCSPHALPNACEGLHEDAIIVKLVLQGRCNSDPNARSVTVMITDNCPQCEPDHIDVQALTYNKVIWPLARPLRKALQAD